MKNYKSKKIIYVILAIAILIISILPIIIFKEHAEITKYSIPSFVFAFCSIVYAIIAISLKERFNLFFLNLYIIARMFNKSYNKTQEYKESFIRFAFVYCASIPFFITLSFFVDNFYSGITQPIEICIIRDVAIILLGFVPPFIKNSKAKKQEQIKQETDRKEQERRESMGQWK